MPRCRKLAAFAAFFTSFRHAASRHAAMQSHATPYAAISRLPPASATTPAGVYIASG